MASATRTGPDDPLTLVADFALMPARVGLALVGHAIALSRTIAAGLRRSPR